MYETPESDYEAELRDAGRHPGPDPKEQADRYRKEQKENRTQ